MTSLTIRVLRWPRFRAVRARNTKLLRSAEERLSRPPAWWMAVACVALLQAALIFSHRPWLDEIQALQLAVEAPDLSTLVEWLRYEGHPPLFYLILRGLAHFVDPFTALPVTAAILAAVTQYCILMRSPFARAERLLIATSEFVLFEFLTLSRSLTLGVTIVVLVVVLWRRRWSWLAIALLPLCDFLFGVLSVIFVLLKLRERQVFWPGAALWAVSGAASAWLVLPAPDMLPALEGNGLARDLVAYLAGLGTLAVPFQGGILPQWNEPPLPLAGVLWLPFVALCWSSTRGDRLHRGVLAGFIGLTLAFTLIVYPLAVRHLMLIALLLIVLTWLRRREGAAPQPGFRLWLAIAAVCGLSTAAINLVRPFDTAEEAAAAIERLGLADKHWMVWPDSRAQVVAALSGIDFERTERHCMQSGIRWNYRTSLNTAPRLKRYLASEARLHGRFYLLSDIDLAGVGDTALLRRIADIDPGYDGQSYHLYVVGPNVPDRPVVLPPCMPGRRPFARL